MSQSERTERFHALPELMDSVINGPADSARTGGWQVKIHEDTPLGTVVEVGKYDEPPETGGVVENVATIPIDLEVNHRAE